MHIGDAVARVRRLSDDELLAGLSGTLGSSRTWAALVLAHLAEVEERRLHLLAGYGSMFAYCTVRLGMSEDEACRRISVAQLARRFPILYEKLAGGAISLSVALLLKHRLTETNCAELLAGVSGKTVGQAREVLAPWFPQPDVPSSIRKLPERTRIASSSGNAASIGGRVTLACSTSAPGDSFVGGLERAGAEAVVALPSAPVGIGDARAAGPAPAAAIAAAPATERDVLRPEPLLSVATPLEPPSRAGARASSTIEPLSPERYKIAFTADAGLKRKLELARDLLRHAVPGGDLATIVGRALDLLIDETMRRKFAKTSRSNREPGTQAPPTAMGKEPADRSAARCATVAVADGAPPTSSAMPTPAAPASLAEPAFPLRQSRNLPNGVRRTVVDRDGLRCTWQGPDGTRCESRAWLELDHIDPRAKGGLDDPSNIRMCCRAHNLLAAEQTYGRKVISQIVARRRGRQHGVETRDDTAMAPAGSGPLRSPPWARCSSREHDIGRGRARGGTGTMSGSRTAPDLGLGEFEHWRGPRPSSGARELGERTFDELQTALALPLVRRRGARARADSSRPAPEVRRARSRQRTTAGVRPPGVP